MRALVTGASSGIGRETAKLLGAQGAEVAVHFHTHRAEAEALLPELRTGGRDPFVVGGDLSDREQVLALAAAVSGRWPELDVLVHNAGSYPRRMFRELTDDEFEACFRTNVYGAATLTRALLPLLDRSGSARIVFVSSILAFTGSRHGAHYAAAKAALLGLARSLARELAPRITVNVVAPGCVDTDILSDDSPEVRAERERAIPLGRIARPREVAEAVAFLASPSASYLTGTTLHVNGGLRLE
ncbi:MAG: SDR family oxidoreductase [Thermoplasmata archaeon]|nr:SDR family oxidoreductase [Thermoplasmata archaeon]